MTRPGIAPGRDSQDVLAASVAVRRGLVLVCLGVFGTVSQRVVRRRDFAIRLALGATRGGIVRHVCAQGLRPVAAGLGAGPRVGPRRARFIDALLFGVAPSSVDIPRSSVWHFAFLVLAVARCGEVRGVRWTRRHSCRPFRQLLERLGVLGRATRLPVVVPGLGR